MIIVNVTATWDADAGIWVATSDDVPGLVTGAASKEELSEKLEHLVPGCFAAAGQQPPEEYEVAIVYH